MSEHYLIKPSHLSTTQILAFCLQRSSNKTTSYKTNYFPKSGDKTDITTDKYCIFVNCPLERCHHLKCGLNCICVQGFQRHLPWGFLLVVDIFLPSMPLCMGVSGLPVACCLLAYLLNPTPHSWPPAVCQGYSHVLLCLAFVHSVRDRTWRCLLPCYIVRDKHHNFARHWLCIKRGQMLEDPCKVSLCC